MPVLNSKGTEGLPGGSVFPSTQPFPSLPLHWEAWPELESRSLACSTLGPCREGWWGYFFLLGREFKEQQGKKCDCRTVGEVVVIWVVPSLDVTSGQVQYRARLEEQLKDISKETFTGLQRIFNMCFVVAVTHSVCSLRNQNDLGKLLTRGPMKTDFAMGVRCVPTRVSGSMASGPMSEVLT